MSNNEGILSVHPEYTRNVDLWRLVDDVCRGQREIKLKKKKYLPVPKMFGHNDDDRYDEYLERAVFYGVTGGTLNSYVGSAFNKLPEFKRPEELDYLCHNADGAGRSIYQCSQIMLRLNLKHYRCGVYVDYPNVAPSQNKADDLKKNAFPMIHVIKAHHILDWDHVIIGNQKKLNYVKILELISSRSVDGFTHELIKQYRILRLENGVYTVQVYNEDGNGNYGEGEIYIPKDYNGQTWDYIPFTFCGAIDNSDEIGNAPLLELAELNLAHYRNSADVEESGFIVGQPTISLPNCTPQMWEIIRKEDLAIGSNRGFPTDVKIVQAADNNLAKQLMTDKWQQMKEMGARLIEVGSANKTATQADNESAVQHSVVSLAVSNISEALTMALRWCARFALPNENLDPHELTYVISQEFNRPSFSEDRAKRLYEACVAGNLPWHVWFSYEQTGVFTEDDWHSIEMQIEEQRMNNPLGTYGQAGNTNSNP